MILFWKKPMEETGYNCSKTEIVTNLSLVPEVTVTWKEPIQESKYEPNKAAMVVHHSTPIAPMDGRSLPIQETDHDQAKSMMVITSPCLLYTSPSPRDGLLSRMPSSA